MNNDQERYFIAGNRHAWEAMLAVCLRQLRPGVDDPVAREARWILERSEAIEWLRRLCDQIGDNDWPSELSLGDVIEKHIRWPQPRQS
jgi:hypothetical protein